MQTAVKELRAVLPGGEKYDKLMSDYKELNETIGASGASDRFAEKMVELLKGSDK